MAKLRTRSQPSWSFTKVDESLQPVRSAPDRASAQAARVRRMVWFSPKPGVRGHPVGADPEASGGDGNSRAAPGGTRAPGRAASAANGDKTLDSPAHFATDWGDLPLPVRRGSLAGCPIMATLLTPPAATVAAADDATADPPAAPA